VWAPYQPSNPIRLISSDGQPIHQAAPAFEVEEYAKAGAAAAPDMKSMNEQLGRPPAVSADEQRLLNEPGYPAAAGAGGPVVGSAALAPGEPEVEVRRPPSLVAVDSTDARVGLIVSYEKTDEGYLTLYDLDFAADYVIRAPDVGGKGVRIAVTFPFPSGCTTVSGAKLLMNEAPDEDHTTYSITGIRWVNWFKPNESKTISIAYQARGQGNYRYVLDKVNLTRQLRLLMRVQGIEPGRSLEVPTDSLTPNVKPTDVQGRWDYVWDYTRLLTTKDIAVNFPAKESPSVAAGRVMQTVGRYLFVARLAPIFLVVFLVALGLGGLWNRAHVLKVEELGMLGIAFLLFYPLFLFGAGYLQRDAALFGAVVVVVILSAAYAGKVQGAGLAARVAVLEIVLLGAFTYALFDKALTGLIFTIGATLLLAYLMFVHGRRAAERASGDPATVARAEVPRTAEDPPEGGEQR